MCVCVCVCVCVYVCVCQGNTWNPSRVFTPPSLPSQALSHVL